MAADPVDPEVLEGLARNAPLTRPRPGHADLAGMQKYGFDDARPILERASARETAARVALGAVAKAFLAQALGVSVVSHVVAIGAVSAPAGSVPGAGDAQRIDEDPVRCLDPAAAAAMVAEIDAARKDGDTLGGVVEVVVHGLPPGSRQPRALGPPAGLPAGRCPHGHPGHQGRRGRRRVRRRGAPAAPRPTTRSSRPRTASAAAPAARAAPRAA